MSVIPEFLQKLQVGKKYLVQNELPTDAQRREWLSNLALKFSESAVEFYAKDPAACVYSREFYQTTLISKAAETLDRTVRLMDEDSESSKRRASGLHTVLVSHRTPLPAMIEVFGASLAAGNAVFCCHQRTQADLMRLIEQMVLLAGFPQGSFQAMNDDQYEALPLFLGHPGVRLITVLGTDETIEKALAGVSWLDKKWQVFRSGKTSALVLADADLEEAADGIIKAVSEGQGTLSWNVSRVIVLEAIESEFKKILQNKLLAQRMQVTDSAQQKKSALLRALTSEQARDLAEGAPVTALENVSNCSEYHQLELETPVLFLISIKYAFDAAKWINNLPNALGLQVWGSDEKIDKLLPKLETAQVFRRSWIGALETWNQGLKSSFAGTLDPRWNGFFYSDRMNL
ncbi:MAG: aldehyde dehydrogenase family protein [Bdellovibrio sp.]|jgi:acyl-CoA reductase-like NAD-dependent aldehyde dehydrogenase